jgi:hypothetical protein
MKYSVNTANNFGIIIKDTKRMPIIPIDNFLNDFRYTVTCNQYKSEIKCALSPFSFFKDRNYILFRGKR